MRFIYVVFLMFGLTIASIAQNAAGGPQARPGGAAPPPAMTLTIAGFPDGGHIPVKFSQAAPGVPVGEGTSPAIQWANAPAGTQSFVLHMHDKRSVELRLSPGAKVALAS